MPAAASEQIGLVRNRRLGEHTNLSIVTLLQFYVCSELLSGGPASEEAPFPQFKNEGTEAAFRGAEMLYFGFTSQAGP